jgi:hypothetical protein
MLGRPRKPMLRDALRKALRRGTHTLAADVDVTDTRITTDTRRHQAEGRCGRGARLPVATRPSAFVFTSP